MDTHTPGEDLPGTFSGASTGYALSWCRHGACHKSHQQRCNPPSLRGRCVFQAQALKLPARRLGACTCARKHGRTFSPPCCYSAYNKRVQFAADDGRMCTQQPCAAASGPIGAHWPSAPRLTTVGSGHYKFDFLYLIMPVLGCCSDHLMTW